MPRFALIALCVVLALGGGIQAVPYGRRHENPPVLAEPSWDTPHYTICSASARLSVTEKELLARGLAVTLATGRGAIGTRESNDER
jgi:hypothetical protein